MSHGPDEDADLDRLMALDEAEFNKEATGQEVQGDPTPAPAAAEPAPPSSGGHEAPAAGGESGGNPDAAGASDTDWLSSLPEDVQTRIREERTQREAALRESEDRYKALHGKVAPTQRALSEAQARLTYYERQQPAQPAQQPPVQQPGQSLDSFYDSADWKDWEQTFPGDAKVLRSVLDAQQKHWQSRIDSIEGRYNQLASRLDSTAQVVTSRTVSDEIGRLEAAHPDWREHDQSDEFWAWADQWRAAQPKSLRGVYYDEAAWREMWNDSDFTSARLTEYKAAKAPPPVAQTPAPPAPAVPTPQPASTQPPVPQPRDPRLAMGVAPDVRSAAVPPAVPTEGMSEAQLFDHIWNTTPG